MRLLTRCLETCTDYKKTGIFYKIWDGHKRSAVVCRGERKYCKTEDSSEHYISIDNMSKSKDTYLFGFYLPV